MFSHWIVLNVFCFIQDDKDPSSTKESLDDLFPTEDEEQSQSKAFLWFVNMSSQTFFSQLVIYTYVFL